MEDYVLPTVDLWLSSSFAYPEILLAYNKVVATESEGNFLSRSATWFVNLSNQIMRAYGVQLPLVDCGGLRQA